MKAPWPVELRYSRDDRALNVTFESGEKYKLPAEYLRVESPSAEVQGHGASTKVTVAGKKSVAIDRMEPIGRYAVRIVFDDGHDSGLYSWDLLYKLGAEKDALMAAYRETLIERTLRDEA